MIKDKNDMLYCFIHFFKIYRITYYIHYLSKEKIPSLACDDLSGVTVSTGQPQAAFQIQVLRSSLLFRVFTAVERGRGGPDFLS